MKKAKKNLGDVGSDDRGAPRAATAADSARKSGAESVESMLQEFSTVGTRPPGSSGPHRGEYDQLWQLSMSDPHTGLANQLLLLDRLTQALARRRRHGGEVLVCHVELDNLGEINLDMGYTTGSEVLRETARRLTSVLRVEDTIGRVGSSELVVVVAVTDEHAVDPLTRRLQHTLDQPVVIGSRDVRLQASLGVALARASESAEEVLARADRSSRVMRR